MDENRLIFIGKKAEDESVATIESVKNILFHTAIIGQSGSGKSFLLGRLIEEIIMNTWSKILIFDTNADFIKIKNIKEDNWHDKKSDIYQNLIWDKYAFDASAEEFRNEWNQYVKDIHLFDSRRGGNRIAISWNNLKIDEWYQLLSIDENQQPEIVFLLDTLITYAKKNKWNYKHWVILPRLIMNWAKNNIVLERNGVAFDESIAKYVALNFSPQASLHLAVSLKKVFSTNIWNKFKTNSRFEKLIDSVDFRLLNINIASIKENQAKFFIIRHVLELLWNKYIKERWDAIKKRTEEEDKRVPMFIIIDEVHRVAPTETDEIAQKAILELLKQIAAEGRKYGLFLFVATQRPKKLHGDILSECENVCIMRLLNRTDYDLLMERFSFIDVTKFNLSKLGKYKHGHCIFGGAWVKNDTVELQIAPQRTMPCGGNIPSKNYVKAGREKQMKMQSEKQ